MFSVFSKSDKQGNGVIAYDMLIARNGYMNYHMNLPIRGIDIKVNTTNEDRDNGSIFTNTSAVIKVKGQTIKKEAPYIGERKRIDIDKVIHAVVAYDYIRQNEPSQESLFLQALNRVLNYEENAINSQGMLDNVFGEGKVNLDSLVEVEVDRRIEMNNAYYDKHGNNSFLGKLKGGLVKMTKPFRLAFDKIKDLINGPEIDDYYDRF